MTSTDRKPRDLLTVDDLAERFGIARSSAYRLARQIPSYRLPGIGLRFHLDDVLAFEERFRREPVKATRPARRRPAGMPVARTDTTAPGADEQLTELMARAGLSLKGV